MPLAQAADWPYIAALAADPTRQALPAMSASTGAGPIPARPPVTDHGAVLPAAARLSTRRTEFMTIRAPQE